MFIFFACFCVAPLCASFMFARVFHVRASGLSLCFPLWRCYCSVLLVSCLLLFVAPCSFRVCHASFQIFEPRVPLLCFSLLISAMCLCLPSFMWSFRLFVVLCVAFALICVFLLSPVVFRFRFILLCLFFALLHCDLMSVAP